MAASVQQSLPQRMSIGARRGQSNRRCDSRLWCAAAGRRWPARSRQHINGVKPVGAIMEDFMPHLLGSNWRNQEGL